MNEVDSWIYLDGPEPEHLRSLLDAFRDAAPATPPDKARAVRRFFEALDADLLPGAAPPSAEAPLAPPAPPHPPPVARSPGVPAGPTQPLEIPPAVLEPMSGLPFKPPRPDSPRAERTQQTPVMRTGHGETTPIGDNSIEVARALYPFAPGDGDVAVAVVVPVPPLTLTEYASLCAELVVHPTRTAALLVQYRVVTAEAHRALHDHWRKRLADRPEERAKFEAILALYIEWVRTRKE